MPIDPYCTECHKVTGGCVAHAASTTITVLPPGPGCASCSWTGMVGVQSPLKPLGVTMCSVPCPACSPNQETD